MKWFRLYSSVLNDPKVQQLSPDLFKHWINILCVASEHQPRGTLPPIKELAFALRLKPIRCAKIVESLCAAGVLEWCSDGTSEVQRAYSARTARVHNWDIRQRESDNVAARVEKYRHRKEAGSDAGAIRNVTLQETLQKRTVDTDTERETDTETFPLSGEVSYKAAVVAPAAPTAATAHGHNHWDAVSAKRTAEEVARRVRLRSQEIPALMNYIKACPMLSHELILGEAESFVAWLNKSHKAAEARVFYNRWLKPANQELQQQQHLQEKSMSNGHHTTGSPATQSPTFTEAKSPSDFEQRYHAELARRAKQSTQMVPGGPGRAATG